MTKIICLDTNILILGIKEEFDNEEDKKKIEMAKSIIDYCVERQYEIIIPTICLSEMLYRETDEIQIKRYIKILSEKFKVVPYCEKCAIYAQRVYNKAIKDNLKKDKSITKQCLKVDLLITACAKQNGASYICSKDRHYKTLCVSINVEYKELEIFAKEIAKNNPIQTTLQM